MCLYLKDHPGLLEHYTRLVKKFEASCEEILNSNDTDECLALKFHYYSVLLKTTGELHREKGTIDCFIESYVALVSFDCYVIK